MATRDKSENGGKIRYAVVGLGYIAQIAVLPSFAHAKESSELAALVSDDDEKLRRLGREHGVERLLRYRDFDDLLAEGEIDAVYIALPNSLHRDFAVRAARAGVHVLCEKPMALTEPDCEAMIDAARSGGVKLMIAYRLHFERANLEVVEIARSGKIGDLRYFSSDFSMQVRDPENIRLAGELGGGTLWDIGIYCINAVRYLFREEPEEVFAMTAKSDDPRFDEVEETASAVLRFGEDRLAVLNCSFGAADVASYRLVGTKGLVRVEPAYEYATGLEYFLTVGEKTQKRSFRKSDQFAPELVYFSDCILEDREPEPSGYEGLADVRIIRALYRSAEEGRPIALEPFDKPARPTSEQEIRRGPVRPPDLVHARGPSES